jgi:hypothetical protein
MTAKPERRGRKPSGLPPSVRANASLPPATYRILSDIAKQKKVSIAWVIREAVEKYIADQWPLFSEGDRHE